MAKKKFIMVGIMIKRKHAVWITYSRLCSLIPSGKPYLSEYVFCCIKDTAACIYSTLHNYRIWTRNKICHSAKMSFLRYQHNYLNFFVHTILQKKIRILFHFNVLNKTIIVLTELKTLNPDSLYPLWTHLIFFYPLFRV